MRVLKWLAGVVHKPTPNVWGNVIHVIYPYLEAGQWVFDDDRVDLNKEAFVAGADTFIDLGLERLGIKGDDGFRAMFSAVPFPDHQFSLVHKTDGLGGTKGLMGNIYVSPEFNMEGWFCPALYRYFKHPPEAMYIKFEAISDAHIAELKKTRKPPRTFTTFVVDEDDKPYRTHWNPQNKETKKGGRKTIEISEEDYEWFFGGDVSRQ